MKLQIALDTMNYSRASQIAKEAAAGGADWLEAGTPLIKSEGLDSVRNLKKAFGNKTVVADMKVMDVGSLEVEMAAKAGADIVTVLGAASDGTIREAIKAGANYGASVMVDLIDVKYPERRAKEAESFGAEYLCVHIGVDSQMEGVDPLEVLRTVSSVVNIPVAAAGGLNVSNVAGAIEAGAEIIIVGGAITKSPDVKAATSEILEAMRTGESKATVLHKKYSSGEVRRAFELVSTPNISDAMHRKGAMTGLLPVFKGRKFCGPAVTVKTMDGDWAKPVEAIDVCEEGSVLVIDATPGKIAMWGELATNSCLNKKIAGIVVDGAIRDLDDIRELGIPVFYRNVQPNAGEPKGKGEINIEITCAGKLVRKGDWIVADDSGIVVVPRESVVEMANRALEVRERENRLREEIKRGGTLSEVMELLRWEKIG